ncbi:hypothetical protein DPMN_100100, partial [Dreissena polymorpha]
FTFTLDPDHESMRRLDGKIEAIYPAVCIVLLRIMLSHSQGTVHARFIVEWISGSRPDITQIAAVHLKTGFKFSTYVQTTVPISSEAQKVIGISFDDHGIM